MDPTFDSNHIEKNSPVAQVVVLPCCESTNTEALKRLAAGEHQLPSVVITACQTAGRGRGDHQWFSAAGALTFSLIYDFTDIALQEIATVALATGISVAQTLEQLIPTTPAVQLKWPNDIYAQGRKLGGILIESSAAQPSQLVIGIGLNGNNSLDSAPADIRTQGIAITDLTGTTIDLTDLLVLLLNQLDKNFLLLKSKQLDIAALWNLRCMLNKSEVSLAQGDLVHQGRCCGVASDGALILNISGQFQQFYSGVVKK